MSLGYALTALFTDRTPAGPVGVCRIGMGIAMFGRGLKTARDLYWLQYDPLTIQASLYAWAPRLDTMPEILLVSATWLAAAVSLTVGYRARLSAAVLAATILFLHVVDQNFWAHHMYFLGLMMFLFVFVDADAAFSIRAWRGDGRREITAWPILLVKIQLSLVYFFTAISKINPVFLSGHVLMRDMALPADFVSPALAAGVATITVACELFLSCALWVPRLRAIGIAIGTVLHLLVPVWFGPYAGLVVFSVATLSLYALFVDRSDLEYLRSRFPRLAAFVPA
jgi:hypothetical protein